MINYLKKVFKDKYFLIFFFVSVAIYVINLLIVDFVADSNNMISTKEGVIQFKKEYPWLMIAFFHIPDIIFSRLFSFLDDLFIIPSITALAFMYGHIGLLIKKQLFSNKYSVNMPEKKRIRIFTKIIIWWLIFNLVISTTALFTTLIFPLFLLLFLLLAPMVNIYVLIPLSLLGIIFDDRKIAKILLSVLFIAFCVFITLYQYNLPIISFD